MSEACTIVINDRKEGILVLNIYSVYLGDYPGIINSISDRSGGVSCQDFGFPCISVLLYVFLFYIIRVGSDHI